MAGFNAKVTMRHGSYMPGDVVFVKVTRRYFGHWGAPMLYEILDRRTGVGTGDEIDANTFKNQFEKVEKARE